MVMRIFDPDVLLCSFDQLGFSMVEDSFNQMQVQHNIDLDFAGGVRAGLPDQSHCPGRHGSTSGVDPIPAMP
jgi:hypothetical protein